MQSNYWLPIINLHTYSEREKKEPDQKNLPIFEKKVVDMGVKNEEGYE